MLALDRRSSFIVHCAFALFIRICLVIYANFHDKYFTLSYTDIDYNVFTDAARHVVNGKSPYERHTYRYSPLLAILLTLNVLIHQDSGKLVFSLVDVVVAILIRKILMQTNCDNKIQDVCIYLWLYNPLTVVISTRGNADSLSVLLVLLTLYNLQKEYFILAGLTHGLSIHFRLYPVIYSIAMFLSLRKNKTKSYINYLIPNRSQVKLVSSSLISIVVLTAGSYYFYGYKFLYESVLYHLLRKDSKHNFSVYFYMLYLSADQPPDVVQKILILLPQLILLVILSHHYSDKSYLPFAMFTQAVVMVVYNPVMTSQYFFWFLSLLPVCLPNFRMSTRRTVLLIFIWILGQGIWLFTAYLLEFVGYNSFIFIWASSLLFFLINVKILIDIICCYNVSETNICKPVYNK